MNKKIIGLGLVTVFGALLTSCNAGSTSTPTITATVSNGSCTGMTNNSQCTINITYNTNGVGGVALAYSPNPLSPGYSANTSFTTGVSNCQNTISSNTNSSCSITIIYTYQGARAANNSLTFSLGTSSATTAISLNGN